MSGLLQHILRAFFILSIMGLAAAAGAQRQARTDSIVIEGSVTTVPDSLLPGLELQVDLAGHMLHPGDSLAASVPGHSAVRAWGSCVLGRAQWETGLPARVDSISFNLLVDSTGIALCWPTDTVRCAWQPTNNGCFPATSNRDVVRILEQAAGEPFESARFELWRSWLPNRCMSLDQLRSIASLFDDEGRKLDIIRSAPCTEPDRLTELAPLFDSKHYRNTFLEWAKVHP